MTIVSVPLRGKEGAGHASDLYVVAYPEMFPSPCGVRRVRDYWGLPEKKLYEGQFPSPCGVRRVRDLEN